MGNAYLDKQAAARDALIEMVERVAQQEMLDAFCVALHRRAGMGYKRLKGIIEEVQYLQKFFAPAFDVSHPECDYYRELFDRAILEFCPKEKLIPFDKRFDELKKVRYDRKR